MMEYNNPNEHWKKPENQEEFPKGGWWPYIMCFLSFIFVLVLLAMCEGCAPKVIEQIRTEYRDRVVHDTLRDIRVEKDSVWVEKKGDTVYLERLRKIYLDKERIVEVHDTVCKTDSIPYKVEVEKKLTKWESFCIDYGKLMLGGTIVGLIFLLVIFRLKFLH